MPAYSCQIDHGSIADCEPVDEPGVLVNSLTITPTREKQEFKNAAGCVRALRFKNPTISFDFDGYIDTLLVTDLSELHPGTAVASLANFAGVIHGFDPADGVLVYEDPSRELTNEDACKTKFKVTQYPFVN